MNLQNQDKKEGIEYGEMSRAGVERKVKAGRWRYFVIFLLLLIIEVLIALYVHDDFIRPYIGDVLVIFTFLAIRAINETVQYMIKARAGH